MADRIQNQNFFSNVGSLSKMFNYHEYSNRKKRSAKIFRLAGGRVSQLIQCIRIFLLDRPFSQANLGEISHVPGRLFAIFPTFLSCNFYFFLKIRVSAPKPQALIHYSE